MLSKTMADMLLAQVQREWESEFYYLAMMAWCYNNDFEDFGKWFEMQAGEERLHGMKMLTYTAEVGNDISIPSVQVPQADFQSIEHIFELTLAHEEKVTGFINSLVDQALKENDHRTNAFLQWFVSEQVEEEATVRSLLAKLRRAKGDPSALMMIEAKALETRQSSAGSAPAGE